LEENHYLKDEIVLQYLNSDVDQLNKILGVLGSPDNSTLSRIGSERVIMIKNNIRHNNILDLFL
jgi:hypothetical protein